MLIDDYESNLSKRKGKRRSNILSIPEETLAELKVFENRYITNKVSSVFASVWFLKMRMRAIYKRTHESKLEVVEGKPLSKGYILYTE